MKAAMYLRKSRAEENETVETVLLRHKETLCNFAASNKISISDIYEEVVSGDSLFARPEMLKLLENIDQYEAILCMDIDRLGRGNMKEQGIILEAIKTAEVKIITPRKVYDLNDDIDETLSEFQAFMARQELKLIKSRMQRGIKKSAEEGCHMGPPPYGYKNIRVGKKSTLEAIPEEAEVIRRIFNQYAGGVGAYTIAHQLNELGIKPQRIKVWNPVTIKRILKNDVYIGRITYGTLMKSKKPGIKKTYSPESDRIRVKGLHEAIINDELFKAVQRIAKERYMPPIDDFTRIVNPLAGLLKCAKCGHALNMRKAQKGYYYYVCKTKGCVRMSSLNVIETRLLFELQKNLDAFTVEFANVPQSKKSDADIMPVLEAEVDKLKKQKEKLHDLLEQEVYTVTVFNERMGALLQRINQLEKALEDERSNENDSSEKLELLIPKIQSVLSVYNESIAKEKNEMLKSVLKRVLYFRAQEAKPNDITLWLEFK